MNRSKKITASILSLAVSFFLFSGCDFSGGVGSSSFFIPSGSGRTGAVIVARGVATGDKRALYWLAEAFQDAGIIALAITASYANSVGGQEMAIRGGVSLIKSNGDIADRLGKIGLVGFSQGGGAAINLGNMKDAEAVIALAPFRPSPRLGHHAATMILTGTEDTIAPPDMGESAYNRLPQSVPRLYASVKGLNHMPWMAGGSKGSELDFIVAWAQYYLNGDESAYDVFSNGGGDRLTNYQFDPGNGPTGQDGSNGWN